MKKTALSIAALFAGILIIYSFSRPEKSAANNVANVQSISAITFGPNGILFIGDSKSATVFALNTKDIKKAKPSAYDIKNIDQKIAAALGTEAKNITITDMAVNPISKKLYIALQSSDGTPVLLKMDGEKIEPVSLKDMNATSVVLNSAPAEDAKDDRGRSLRVATISDLGYDNGKLLVSGLSNKEFASTFRSIPYPFTNVQDEASLEIYHTAHGRYETSAPIRTFTTATINNKKYIVASYTCTPLVLFPMDELKPGSHVKGRTVAEMGSGNSPIDMISLQNGNEWFLMMANTKHPVAKVDYKNIAAFESTLTEPVKGGGTAGVQFTATPMTGVLQMDKLDDKQVVMLQKKTNGDIDLSTTNEAIF